MHEEIIMNLQEQDGEVSMSEAVEGLDTQQIHQRAASNAAKLGMELTNAHLEVIDSLIEHYKTDCEQDDCLDAHRQMRFLEKEFSDQGGSKYLYQLFNSSDKAEGVLHVIHQLAELPGLRLDVDKGFGTAF
jgi:sulfur relay (sulfurtransferase) DsrC/TusE family protein